MRIHYLLVAVFYVCFVGWASRADAQTQQSPHTFKLDNPSNATPAKVAELAWLQGHWTATAFAGTVEEIWSPPLGNAMMGMFRVVKDGKVVFYELCTLVQQNESVVLRLKHFHPDLKGWEEKDASVTFPLIKLAKDKAYFDGLTIEKEGDDSLIMYLMIQPKNGKA